MQGTPAMEILSLPSRKAVTHAIKSIQDQIGAGYSYLVNYCSQTEVELHHSVAAIYRAVRAPFRVWFENRFLCFSPEAFVSVVDNRICTTPMKGTGYDAARLLSDAKEKAEHATVVDLLRNDLGSVAREVRLGRYRFLTAIAQSDARVLYQTSTEIYGRLTADWPSRVGEWLSLLLPAGSVTGAPKKKTVELIRAHESQARGFFTGIAALFDGRNFYSCVLIRFIDLAKRPYVFRSGAGITVDSDADAEYDEIVSKVYIPL